MFVLEITHFATLKIVNYKLFLLYDEDNLSTHNRFSLLEIHRLQFSE